MPPIIKKQSFASMLKAGKGKDNTVPHLIVKARAGTGKTSTLIEGLKIIRGVKSDHEAAKHPSEQQLAIYGAMCRSDEAVSINFVAFNKSIADELKRRVPEGCDAMTSHGLGLRAVKNVFGNLREPNQHRNQNLLAELMGYDIWKLRRDMPVLLKSVDDLTDLCKLNLVAGDDPTELEALAEYYDVDVVPETYDWIPQVLERCKDVKRDGYISFTDMIWLPYSLDLAVPTYDLLLVDEMQDLNRCQQYLVRKAGKRLIMVGDDRQCQPTGTMVRRTGSSKPVPIESLKVGDQLVSYSTNSAAFMGKRTQGRKVEEIASREYTGDLYKINGSSSTPNHKWLTRFRSDVPAEYTALYLTELPDGTFRIGITQLAITGGFGPGLRARQRGATKLWLLHVFKDRLGAREAEFKDAVTYRIPQLACYEDREDTWCRDLVDSGVTSDIDGLLASYSQIYEYPIWSKGDGQHIGKYSYVTQACNLITDVNEVCLWNNGEPNWVPIDLSIEPDWSGTVYSLKVQHTEGGRRLYISDNVVTHNSIYGFAGADSQSMSRMYQELSETEVGCEQLSLNYTRRCGKAIVREANKYVSDFYAFDTNPEGMLAEATFEGEDCYRAWCEDDDMVLCRTNAPLVSECFKFLKVGRPAYIQGRDVGAGLVKVVKKIVGNESFSIEQLLAGLHTWSMTEIQKENAKANPSETKLQGIQDKYECLCAFCEDAKTVDQLILNIESLFADKERKGVRFSSIHRAKGLESERVFLLQPKQQSYGFKRKGKRKQSEWESEQEQNLKYVAITRAINELIYVRDNSSDNER